MKIADILQSDRIRCGVEVASKKRALEVLGELMCQGEAGVSTRSAFDCLLARERLGSTCLGFGVAIPHGRMENLAATVGAVMTLRDQVDFDASDGRGVDVLFGLLVPAECTDEHLQLLAELAETFSDEKLRDRIRASTSVSDVYEMLAGSDGHPGIAPRDELRDQKSG